MFDTLYLPCPMCEKETYVQSKGGPCMMEVYKWEEELPPWLMWDLDNTTDECMHCGKRFLIRFDIEILVKNKTTEPVDNLDIVAWVDRKNKRKKENGQS